MPHIESAVNTCLNQTIDPASWLFHVAVDWRIASKNHLVCGVAALISRSPHPPAGYTVSSRSLADQLDNADRKTVERALDLLVEREYLVVLRPGSGRRPATYAISLPATHSKLAGHPVTHKAAEASTGGTSVVGHLATHKPSESTSPAAICGSSNDPQPLNIIKDKDRDTESKKDEGPARLTAERAGDVGGCATSMPAQVALPSRKVGSADPDVEQTQPVALPPAAVPQFDPAAAASGLDDHPDRLEAIAELERDAPIETDLVGRCWFSYRRMSAFEKTCLFAKIYNEVLVGHFKNHHAGNLALTGQTSVSLLKFPYSPWLNTGNGQWKGFVKARRQADALGADYSEYVAGALLATVKRGWKYVPQPNQLYGAKILGRDPKDRFTDATIPAYLSDLHSGKVRFCDDPYFRAEGYLGEPLQVEYLTHIAHSLKVTVGDRAADLWARYQRDGKLPACVPFSQAIGQEA